MVDCSEQRKRGSWTILSVFVGTMLTASTTNVVLFAQQPDPRAFVRGVQHVFVDVIEKTEPSVVAIARINRRRISNQPGNRLRDRLFPDPRRQNVNKKFDPQSPDFIPNEFASGIIIAGPGPNAGPLILTNYHVVKGGPSVSATEKQSENRIYVKLANRRGFDARIFAADPRSDLAVLKPDGPQGKALLKKSKPIELGDASGIRKGQFVVTLGNPYAIARDGSASASWGFISNIARFPITSEIDERRQRISDQTAHLGTLLQVDARLEFGTSGGALVDLDGKLIGITTSLAAIEGYEKSTGYAVPIDQGTRRVIDALIRGYEVEYGFLGIRPDDVSADKLDRYSKNFEQSSAVEITAVAGNSPASRGGLQLRDLILSINRRPLHGRYDLMREVSLLGPGTTVDLTVWRDNTRKQLNLKVTLGKWPWWDEMVDEIVAPNSRFPTWRGIQVDYLTGRRRFVRQFDTISRYPDAVAVTQVVAGSDVETNGIETGTFITHVNGQPVRTPQEFHKIASAASGDVTLKLLDGNNVVVKP